MQPAAKYFYGKTRLFLDILLNLFKFCNFWNIHIQTERALGRLSYDIQVHKLPQDGTNRHSIVGETQCLRQNKLENVWLVTNAHQTRYMASVSIKTLSSNFWLLRMNKVRADLKMRLNRSHVNLGPCERDKSYGQRYFIVFQPVFIHCPSRMPLNIPRSEIDQASKQATVEPAYQDGKPSKRVCTK